MVRRRKTVRLDELWSVEEAAKYLGIPAMTLYAWKHRGKVRSVEMPGRAVVFDRAEIRKLRRELRKERKHVINEKAHTGVPTWFRATCHEASRGGVNSYEFAGKQLGRHVGHEIPHALDYDEWDAEVETLRSHCVKRDLKKITEWLVEYYPRMMALVPTRRREALAVGVLDAYEETEGLPVE